MTYRLFASFIIQVQIKRVRERVFTAAADLWFWRQCSWRQLKYQRFAYSELRSGWAVAVCRPERKPIIRRLVLLELTSISHWTTLWSLPSPWTQKRRNCSRCSKSQLFASNAWKAVLNLSSVDRSYSYDLFNHVKGVHWACSFHWPGEPRNIISFSSLSIIFPFENKYFRDAFWSLHFHD